MGFFNSIFRKNRIGNSGPVHWPSRSPDLTVVGYFLKKMYKTPVYDIGDLRLGEINASNS